METLNNLKILALNVNSFVGIRKSLRLSQQIRHMFYMTDIPLYLTDRFVAIFDYRTVDVN